jgi:hypothetical protein
MGCRTDATGIRDESEDRYDGDDEDVHEKSKHSGKARGRRQERERCCCERVTSFGVREASNWFTTFESVRREETHLGL